MPATRYDYRSGSYEIQCQECLATVHANSAYDENATAVEGGLVSDTFRWLRGPFRWQYLCRSCEREYNRARRARSSRRRQTRVPGMTRSALGTARRFGVEFECGIPSNVGRDGIRRALAAEGLTGWTIKGDGSLSIPGMVGTEIVSPPLSGDDGEEQVRKAARALRSVGAVVNRTCGTHVHHDIADLSVEEIKRVARSWFNNQGLINGLVSPSRRGLDGSGYCQPLQPGEVARIEQATTLDSIRSLPIGRYRTLNLTSYGRYGTVEIRQHQGTLDAEKVISWMRFGQAIIDTAKTQPTMGPASTMRSMFEYLGDRLNETARTFLLGRAVEFGLATV